MRRGLRETSKGRTQPPSKTAGGQRPLNEDQACADGGTENQEFLVKVAPTSTKACSKSTQAYSRVGTGGSVRTWCVTLLSGGP